MRSRERGNPIGATGRTVGENLRRLRNDRRWTQADLSQRLAESGHPIPIASIGRIESADRRVEVDDLVALAVVLGVSPLALLLPFTRHPNDHAELTGWGAVSAMSAWQWAASAIPLELNGSADDMEADANYAIRQSFPWWLRVDVARESPIAPNSQRLWDSQFNPDGTPRDEDGVDQATS